MFNAPRVVLALIGSIVLAHFVKLILPGNLQTWFQLFLSFIPAKFTTPVDGMMIWVERAVSSVSYMFVHGDFMHLGFNSVWLLVFGTPLARRWSSARFLIFFFVCGIFGAFAHLALQPQSMTMLVGASGAISGLMGAAVRFALFPPVGQPFSMTFHQTVGPSTPISDRRVLGFTLVWSVLNIVLGMSNFMGSEGALIAWDVHLFGYFAGLFLFGPFDRLVDGDGSGPEQQKRPDHLRVIK